MDTGTAVGAAGVMAAVLTFAFTHFRTKAMAELESRLVKVETKLDLYFDFQERYNAQILHRDDDNRNVDKILEKIETLEPVSKSEDELLEATLTQIISDSNEIMGTRAAAAQLLAARKARNGPCR